MYGLNLSTFLAFKDREVPLIPDCPIDGAAATEIVRFVRGVQQPRYHLIAAVSSHENRVEDLIQRRSP